MANKKSPELAQKLLKISIEAIPIALQTFTSIKYTDHKNYKRICKSLEKSLLEIQSEDEILVKYSDNTEILNYYIKSSIVLTYLTIMQIFDYKYLPVDKIKDYLINSTNRFNSIDDNLDFLITQTPAQHHLELVKKPIIVNSNGVFFTLRQFSTEHWVNWVRNETMKGGAVASKVGKSWEKYFENLFKEKGWEIVGSSIKIKDGKRVLTDLDLVLFKEGVVITFQMKVFYYFEIDTYTQWKSRKKLNHAANQLSLIGENKIIEEAKNRGYNNIKQVIPIILTNSHIYNGYEINGIKVLSLDSLNQFFTGSKVDFETSAGKNLGRKFYYDNSKNVVQNLIDFIDTPLDWKISDEKLEISIYEEKLEHCTLKIPISNLIRP